jgi:hypothetical protein
MAGEAQQQQAAGGQQQQSGQAPDATQQQQGQVAGQAPGTDPQQEGFNEPFDEARARSLIDKLRPYEKRATDAENALESAQQRLKEFEDADKTDMQKLADQVSNMTADLEASFRENRRLKVQVMAGGLGIIDPAAAAALIDWDALGETPKDDQLKAALTQMADDRPWLKGNQQQGQQTYRQDEEIRVGATNAGRTGQEQEPIKSFGSDRVREYHRRKALADQGVVRT